MKVGFYLTILVEIVKKKVQVQAEI